MDKVIVSLVGIAGIIFVYWFFLGKKDKIVAASDSIDIVVDGGYNPETISVKKGLETKINFTRHDPSTCLEEVVLPEFKVKRFLPLNKTITISIKPKNYGTFEIVCGMNMFHGKIIVD